MPSIMMRARPPASKTIFGRLRREQGGSTIVEFAMVAAPLVALIVAIFQITLTFFAQQALETASDKAVRALVTGTAQKTGMTQTQFTSLVCANLPAFMNCTNVLVDVRVATAFSVADTNRPTITYDSSGNPNNLQFTSGASGEITVAKIMYIWQGQRGPLGFDISNMSDSKRLLVATAVFKTEPYA